jgi:hypothetical protein
MLSLGNRHTALGSIKFMVHTNTSPPQKVFPKQGQFHAASIEGGVIFE